jgi:hypothetical protein
MLNVVMLSVVMLSVVMMNVVMLNVVMLSIVVLDGGANEQFIYSLLSMVRSRTYLLCFGTIPVAPQCHQFYL